VKRRSGKYFGAGTALRQISLATGGTLTLKRSGKSRCSILVRLTLDQFIFWPKLPPNAGFGIKNFKKKISGGDTPDPFSGRGRPPPARTHPQHGYTPCEGAQAPRCWDLALGKRSPKSKFTTTPLLRCSRCSQTTPQCYRAAAAAAVTIVSSCPH